MCHGVKQKAFYDLPEGQAALRRNSVQDKLKDLDTAAPQFAPVEAKPGSLETIASINGPRSSPSVNTFSLGVFLRPLLLWYELRNTVQPSH